MDRRPLLEPESLVADLTEAQREAVVHIDGPLLVLAGPGSGKTRVITRRVAYLVAQGIPAWSVLAVTFTNKAAGEMRDRIDALLPHDLPGRRGLTVSTFHALCARLLRRFAPRANLDAGFVIYDAADQREAMKRALSEADMDSSHWPPAMVASVISRAKNDLLDAAAYASQAGDFHARAISRAFTAYEKVLRDCSAVDFDDLLLLTATLLREDQLVLEELQQRFRYILVDEYQDTNRAQFLIAHALSGPPAGGANICVVGDPDQSIYGWRGADVRNILDFEDHYPQARVVPLGENFRSTGHIVEAAAGLIAHNRRRRDRPLYTALGEGEKVSVVVCQDEQHEAAMMLDRVRRLREEGVPYREMAVLYRMNALSRVLEAALRDAQVPYVVARGTAFYDRKEIRDALAYLRLILNPADDVALRRTVSTPPRGIGATTLERLDLAAIRRRVTLFEMMRRVEEVDSLPARSRSAVTRFAAMIDAFRDAAFESPTGSTSTDLAHLVAQVIRVSGLEELHGRDSGEDVDRLANLDELVSAAAQFRPADADDFDADDIADIADIDDIDDVDDAGGAGVGATTMSGVSTGVTGPGPSGTAGRPTSTAPAARRIGDLLAAFLESVALVSDADAVDPERGAVTLMTLHAAKGLEFDSVVIVGLEQGTLPHARGLESDAELEEERRLCFVGMTRARRHLLLTTARRRTMRGMTEGRIASHFLTELPAGAVEREDRGSGDSAGGMAGASGPILVRELDEDAPFGGLVVGSIVRHARFGIGRVMAIMPRGISSSVRVDFRDAGEKTLVLEHARLERMS